MQQIEQIYSTSKKKKVKVQVVTVDICGTQYCAMQITVKKTLLCLYCFSCNWTVDITNKAWNETERWHPVIMNEHNMKCEDITKI